METQHIIHNFEPIYNEHSKILMLGTMPSPKSREVGFYYGHPRNRFWKVVSDVCGEAYPETREGKIAFALRMVLQSGMCWRGVILKEQMTAVSVIHSRMIWAGSLNVQILRPFLRQERKHFNYIRNFAILRLGLWQLDCRLRVRRTAEHRMSSSMKHILKSENIWNKESDIFWFQSKRGYSIMDNLVFSLNATVPIFLMMVLGLFFNKIGVDGRRVCQ